MAKDCPQLTTEQKKKAVEYRRRGKTYQWIADIMDIELSVLQYRLMQHMKSACPELVNCNGKIRQPIKNKLTNDDLQNYKHVDNSKKFEYSDKVILKVDINPDIDKATEPTVRLCDGPQGSRLGVVIGSQWDDSPKLFTTAKKKITNSMYKTSKNVNGKCVHG